VFERTENTYIGCTEKRCKLIIIILQYNFNKTYVISIKNKHIYYINMSNESH